MKRIGLIAMIWLGAGVHLSVAQPLAFDAASIKPTPADRSGGFPYRVGPGSLSMRALLKGFIVQAYDVAYYQVDGGPAWAQSELYDIQAKADGEADQHRIKVMLRTLLADRFQLKVHHETRMMAGYVLSVDKGGLRLPAARTDVPPDSEGVIQVGGGVVSRGSTIKHLALGLTLELGRPVIDQTNIEGHYDFTLRFDDSDATGVGTADSPSGFGSVFGALHEIGLTLEARKVPIEMLVIDSADRPSEN